jgi:hypothetical protein
MKNYPLFGPGRAIAAIGLLVSLLTPLTAFAADSALERYQTAERIANEHLVIFDTLDFDVYSTQAWDRFTESHAPDILVHYPDGHTTKGLKAHIEELKPMFVFAPDTTIKVHPVRIAQAEWTSVIGVMTGTFTKPMPIGNGKFIQPTGKPFKLTMCTVGHWVNGLMDEEFLFWDNASFMQQIGVGQ